MTALDPFLLGLFREEMAVHCEALSEGFLSLERSAGVAPPADTESMMRAAHSIKGAARVVELGAISRVAHVMEDLLLDVGERRRPISPGLIDHLLGALDWMSHLAAMEDQALADHLALSETEADLWVRRLGTGPAGQEGGEPSSLSLPPPVAEPQDSETPPPPPSPQPPEREAEHFRPETSSDRESSVRLSADNLSRILAHSASLLLEARQLEQLLASKVRIPRQLRRIGGQLGAGDALGPADRPEQRLAELADHLESGDRLLVDLSLRLNRLSERLHELVLRGRLRPFAEGTQGFSRMIRDLARALGKRVDLSILGASTLIDRDILSGLDAPLNHLLRNALDHGIETEAERLKAGKPPMGRIVLEARHLGGRLLITLEDDGRGIDAERLRKKIVDRGLLAEALAAQLEGQELFAFLFLPGLSTRESVSEISGRGFGLDIVQTMVHSCGGSLRVFSEPSKGTRFELQLPVTRSVVRCLRVRIGEAQYALPLSRIDRAMRLPVSAVEVLNGMAYFTLDQLHVALVSAHRLFDGESSAALRETLSLVVFSQENRTYALEVDALIGETDLVVRPLDPRLGKVAYFSAAAIDAEGCPLLIFDVEDLVRTIDRLAGEGDSRALKREAQRLPDVSTKRVLVVDDSLTVREVERKHLQNAGFSVEVAVDGMDGWNQLVAGRFDLLVTDVDMPRMNGIELVRRVRADSRYETLPVVIVSYKDREEDRLLGMQAGADYYLTKSSFHDSSLIKAVTDLIGTPEDL